MKAFLLQSAATNAIVSKIENGLERGFVKHRLNCLLITDPESLLMHSDNHRKHLIYFYIYVHLDKAKTATLAKLKASSDVIKRDRSRCWNAVYYHAENSKI